MLKTKLGVECRVRCEREREHQLLGRKEGYATSRRVPTLPSEAATTSLQEQSE